MQCKQCGRQLSDDALVCFSCGEPTGAGMTYSNAQQSMQDFGYSSLDVQTYDSSSKSGVVNQQYGLNSSQNFGNLQGNSVSLDKVSQNQGFQSFGEFTQGQGYQSQPNTYQDQYNQQYSSQGGMQSFGNINQSVPFGSQSYNPVRGSFLSFLPVLIFYTLMYASLYVCVTNLSLLIISCFGFLVSGFLEIRRYCSPQRKGLNYVLLFFFNPAYMFLGFRRHFKHYILSIIAYFILLCTLVYIILSSAFSSIGNLDGVGDFNYDPYKSHADVGDYRDVTDGDINVGGTYEDTTGDSSDLVLMNKATLDDMGEFVSSIENSLTNYSHIFQLDDIITVDDNLGLVFTAKGNYSLFLEFNGVVDNVVSDDSLSISSAHTFTDRQFMLTFDMNYIKNQFDESGYSDFAISVDYYSSYSVDEISGDVSLLSYTRSYASDDYTTVTFKAPSDFEGSLDIGYIAKKGDTILDIGSLYLDSYDANNNNIIETEVYLPFDYLTIDFIGI